MNSVLLRSDPNGIGTNGAQVVVCGRVLLILSCLHEGMRRNRSFASRPV